MTAPWPDLFDKTLRLHLPLLDADSELKPDLPLADAGLDSLASVELLLAIEEAFEVVVPDDRLTGASFSTPTALWQLVSDLRS